MGSTTMGVKLDDATRDRIKAAIVWAVLPYKQILTTIRMRQSPPLKSIISLF